MKNLSWKTYFWVTLGDFAIKKKGWEQKNLYSDENQLSKNKMWGVADNHIDTCHTYVKGILDSNFNSF